MTDPKKLWERAWELVPKEDTGSGLWNALGALGLGKFAHTGKGKAKVLGFTPDGGLDFDFTEKLKELHLSISKQDLENETLEKVREAPTLERSDKSITSLNIAILVVGTRGDVQPFIALGMGLEKVGHRVRLASHANFREFVTSFGLEFYPLGGDPKVLSQYVVRNRGVIPAYPQDVPENRQQLREIVFSTYAACTEPDPEGNGREFTAHAIIANPPSMGHIHCAEKLGVPLHMMFTMPWTRTEEFMHPMARITRGLTSTFEKTTQAVLGDASNQINTFVRRRMNFETFSAVENIIFFGMKDIIDEFRTEVLGLQATGIRSADRHILRKQKIPFTYCWSPALVPKPKDWGDHIDVVGFFILNQSSLIKYTPPDDLVAFLSAGPPPVYFGFGSMVIPDAAAVNKCIVEAVAATGIRALVSKGWGGLGEDINDPNIFVLGNCPHDWLFTKCSGVVHHGGAGTTSVGLLAACPTLVVPFFGDQPFWGSACHKAGVGPEPLSIDDLRTKNLTKALKLMQDPSVIEKAKEVSEKMKLEDGVKLAVEAFHR